MQPLSLNLSSHPFRNNTLLWIGHASAVALLLLFTGWNVRAYLEQRGSMRELETQVRQMARKHAELDMRGQKADIGITRHDLKELAIEAATANDVILKKGLSWTRLFNLLEKVIPYEVRAASIRPAFGAFGRTGPESAIPEASVPVTLQGYAQSLEAFLEFERSLLMDAHFDHVEPDKNDVGAGGEVAFSVGFLYFPEGRAVGKERLDLPHVLAAAAEEAAASEDVPGGSEAASAPAPASVPPVAAPAATQRGAAAVPRPRGPAGAGNRGRPGGKR